MKFTIKYFYIKSKNKHMQPVKIKEKSIIE